MKHRSPPTSPVVRRWNYLHSVGWKIHCLRSKKKKEIHLFQISYIDMKSGSLRVSVSVYIYCTCAKPCCSADWTWQQKPLSLTSNISHFLSTRLHLRYCVYLQSISFELAPTAGLKQTVSLTPCHLPDLAGCYCSQLQGLTSSCNHLWQSASVLSPCVPPTSFPSALRGYSSLHSVSTLLLSVLPLRDLPDLCRGDWRRGTTQSLAARSMSPWKLILSGSTYCVSTCLLHRAWVHSGTGFWGKVLPNGRAGIVVWLDWFTVCH